MESEYDKRTKNDVWKATAAIMFLIAYAAAMAAVVSHVFESAKSCRQMECPPKMKARYDGECTCITLAK